MVGISKFYMENKQALNFMQNAFFIRVQKESERYLQGLFNYNNFIVKISFHSRKSWKCFFLRLGYREGNKSHLSRMALQYVF